MLGNDMLLMLKLKSSLFLKKTLQRLSLSNSGLYDKTNASKSFPN